MLAGDAGDAAIAAIVTDVPQPTVTPTESQPINLVFVDANVSDLRGLTGAIDGDHELILLDENRSGVDQISEVLNRYSHVQSMHIIAHGESGKLAIGNEVVSEQTLSQRDQLIRTWSRSLSENADILLYGCRTGEGELGRDFVERLARLTGADVAASIDATGNTQHGGDWELERMVGKIETSVALSHSERTQYQGVLPITITAAGSRNEEQMLLQIDGVTVATYDDIGGDANGSVFETYTYNVDGINADQVRVVFTNDLWDPDNGIDRNLRVDHITIDGTTYETEDPLVFSTGTWLPADGGYIDQSVSIAADDYWLRSIVQTSDTRALPDATEITFAAFGDYGAANAQAPQISSLVQGLAPDIIVTLGDARYSGESYAGVHGAYYSYYLKGATPSAQDPTGGTSSINRFFPAAGNHDYDDQGGINEFIDYFSLPGDGVPTSSDTGSELYYDFIWGPTHFFVMDSEAFLNDPSSQATQTAWLQTELQASTASWQIVVLHIPPYSSGDDHGSNPALQLDYALWGADLVLSGHDHIYERLERDGITYVVSGLGGKSIRGIRNIESGSVVRYNDDYGISYFTATETQIVGSFVSIDGVVQDSFVIDAV